LAFMALGVVELRLFRKVLALERVVPIRRLPLDATLVAVGLQVLVVAVVATSLAESGSMLRHLRPWWDRQAHLPARDELVSGEAHLPRKVSRISIGIQLLLGLLLGIALGLVRHPMPVLLRRVQLDPVAVTSTFAVALVEVGAAELAEEATAVGTAEGVQGARYKYFENDDSSMILKFLVVFLETRSNSAQFLEIRTPPESCERISEVD